MGPIRVRHLIAALEELGQHAEELDKNHDDGVGNNYHSHLGWTIQFLQEEFHENDKIISFE